MHRYAEATKGVRGRKLTMQAVADSPPALARPLPMNRTGTRTRTPFEQHALCTTSHAAVSLKHVTHGDNLVTASPYACTAAAAAAALVIDVQLPCTLLAPATTFAAPACTDAASWAFTPTRLGLPQQPPHPSQQQPLLTLQRHCL
eukprot:GHRQ01027876.1.p1 GENE.GHRQ01027876.1~~GHRQ01027876.1.p1  ORF type:complete len:145 (-),score=22.63 GHRQ01027876.1:519-953(-)